MNPFTLDPRLEADCFKLFETPQYILLLMNNARLPWLILVPKVEVSELYELNTEQQTHINALINRLSRFLKQEFELDKLNIAAIGNIVSQLHIHIVGRRHDDYCWPGVVWGAEGREDYQPEAIKKWQQQIQSLLQADE